MKISGQPSNSGVTRESEPDGTAIGLSQKAKNGSAARGGKRPETPAEVTAATRRPRLEGGSKKNRGQPWTKILRHDSKTSKKRLGVMH
jgi:hypothetical protein